MGESGEGQNITHQQKKMGERRAAARSATASSLPLTDEQVARQGVRQARPRTAPRCATCASAATRSAARCRRARRRPSRCAVPELEPLPVGRSTAPASARSRRRWRSSACSATLLRDKRARPARRADRRRRVADVRHGGDVPPARDLQPGRPALPARGRRAAHVLQGGQARARSSRRASTRRARCPSWIAAATSYANHGEPMIPFYVYYSMFGFQRIGDLAWAAGDSARARVPHRRHRGAHDAQRRGPAARGRPQPPARRDDPQLRRLRPGLRLRGRGDRPGRPAADARRAGGRLLLPDGDERELPAARDAGGRGGGDPARDAPRPRGAGRATCSCWARARSCARCSPAPTCCATTSASRPTSGASPRSPSCAATAWRPSAEPAAPDRRAAACRACAEQLEGRDGPVVAATDYIRARAASRSARGSPRRYTRARHRRLRPQRLPRDAAALLRGRPPPRRRSPRCARSAATEDAAAGDRALRASTPTRRPHGGAERGRRPRHRRLHRRPGHRGARRRRRHASSAEDPLVALESDKATMEVPAPFAGVVARAARQRRRQGLRGHAARRARGRGRGGRAAAARAGGRHGVEPPAPEAASPSSIESAIAAEAQSATERRRPRDGGPAPGGPWPRHRRWRRRAGLREPVRAAAGPRARHRPRDRPAAPAARAASPRRTSTRPAAARPRPRRARRRAGGARRGRARRR